MMLAIIIYSLCFFTINLLFSACSSSMREASCWSCHYWLFILHLCHNWLAFQLFSPGSVAYNAARLGDWQGGDEDWSGLAHHSASPLNQRKPRGVIVALGVSNSWHVCNTADCPSVGVGVIGLMAMPLLDLLRDLPKCSRIFTWSSAAAALLCTPALIRHAKRGGAARSCPSQGIAARCSYHLGWSGAHPTRSCFYPRGQCVCGGTAACAYWWDIPRPCAYPPRLSQILGTDCGTRYFPAKYFPQGRMEFHPTLHYSRVDPLIKNNKTPEGLTIYKRPHY
jgi:hypothetical protein